MLRLLPYTPGHRLAFRALNRAWITRYFTLEPHDDAAPSGREEVATVTRRGPRGGILVTLVTTNESGGWVLVTIVTLNQPRGADVVTPVTTFRPRGGQVVPAALTIRRVAAGVVTKNCVSLTPAMTPA